MRANQFPFSPCPWIRRCTSCSNTPPTSACGRPRPDLNALFAEMAACLVAAMVEDPASVQPCDEMQYRTRGHDREFLLFDWLKELLMRFETDRLLFAAFDVHVSEPG